MKQEMRYPSTAMPNVKRNRERERTSKGAHILPWVPVKPQLNYDPPLKDD